MVQRLDKLLQSCTVKITVPGQVGWGTGFFVAPGLVLTCAHVVKALKPEAAAQISWQQEGFAEGSIAQLIPAFDLALLRVLLPQNTELPCVYLDDAFQPTDTFYTYGYPDSFPDGASVTGQCEGDASENGIPLILFKSGLIRPGFSGSPLLNLRTGKVCGIVKFTRDRSIDLGGGAIPTAAILQQFQQLAQQQHSFHQQNDRWSSLLPGLVAEYERISHILEQIESGIVTPEGLRILRQALQNRSQQTIQVGKYNINIGEGQDIQIGDRTFNMVTMDEAAVQAIVAAIQQHVGRPEGGMSQNNFDNTTNYQTQTGANNTNFLAGEHQHIDASVKQTVFSGVQAGGNITTGDIHLTIQSPTEPPLKLLGVPFPRVRLPENYVDRPEAVKAVKQKLLAEDDRTLVVSAISGLGGLGKSVLATALVLDEQVQQRFKDGILWVTLGQNPDLQTLLGEWIRELDKSRETFSANTLESASRYLDSLLAERRMLLVVDDVWNAAHAEWFRVGGVGCRVLVTTREAQLEGADYQPLDVMTEAEALALVQQKLKRRWRSEQETEVKAFAKLLGYLPLALDLATNQVQNGLTWGELRSEFEAERQAVALGTGRRSSALKLLDSLEAWKHLDENEQRKYSLQACFNLSLKRLSAEELQQFAWLGILPEDVNLSQPVASVLWDVHPVMAKRGLALLRSRSLLTDGVATSEGQPTYRVHDLIHAVARGLIEKGPLNLPIQNPKSSSAAARSAIQNLHLAHRQFLERYRERATDSRWDKLPDDGYIYERLIWHLEQADWVNEIHTLLGETSERGNGWYQARERLGQTAGYISNVSRAWALADLSASEGLNPKVMEWQCRYTLIMASLNSMSDIPGELINALVRSQIWTLHQGLAYARQATDYRIRMINLTLIAKEVPPDLRQEIFCEALQALHKALDVAFSNGYHDVSSESVNTLLQSLPLQLIPYALDIISSAKDGNSRVLILQALSRSLTPSLSSRALKISYALKDESSRALALAALAAKSPEVVPHVLGMIQYDDIEDSSRILVTLINNSPTELLPQILEVVQSIEDKYVQSRALATLANKLPEVVPRVLENVKNFAFDPEKI